MKIERNKYFSIYEQVAHDLRGAIESGTYKPGARIPRETDLARQLGVSKKTLRHALKILEHEGMVIRRRSVGTFVMPEELRRKHSEASLALVISGKYTAATDAYNLFGSAPLEIGEAVRYAAEKGIFFQIFPWLENNRGGGAPVTLKKKGINGVIIHSPMHLRETVRQLAFARFPHVAMESHLNEKGVHTVMWDDEQAAHECVWILLKLGHIRIGFVGGALKAPELNTGNRRRLRGYQKALAEAGVALNEGLVANIESELRESTPICYPALARRLLNAKPRPTAIVSAGFGVAAALWQEALSKGIRIPEQLSLVCVDVNPGNETQWQINDKRFNLSGFVKPMRKIGQTAVDRLLEWIKNRRDFVPRLVKVPFVMKEGSTVAACRE